MLTPSPEQCSPSTFQVLPTSLQQLLPSLHSAKAPWQASVSAHGVPGLLVPYHLMSFCTVKCICRITCGSQTSGSKPTYSRGIPVAPPQDCWIHSSRRAGHWPLPTWQLNASSQEISHMCILAVGLLYTVWHRWAFAYWTCVDLHLQCQPSSAADHGGSCVALLLALSFPHDVCWGATTIVPLPHDQVCHYCVMYHLVSFTHFRCIPQMLLQGLISIFKLWPLFS